MAIEAVVEEPLSNIEVKAYTTPTITTAITTNNVTDSTGSTDES